MTDETKPLYVDQVRYEEWGHVENPTGIFVRAILSNNGVDKWGSYDIVTLEFDSLMRWLRSRGGANVWAESVVCMLLDHDDATKVEEWVKLNT